MKTRWLVLSAAAAVAWTWLYRQGGSWGTTPEERTRYLPGDDLVRDARIVTNHAVTIDAPPERVWPWLVQMGWHRGGWYTYRWVDRLLFPKNAPSAERILREWQDLTIGDHIPDGDPASDCFFRVEILEPEKALVLRSWTHLPAAMRADPRFRLNWTWGFYLETLDGDRTRLLFRTRAELTPWWMRAIYRIVLVPADFVMGRSMCLGIRKRVIQAR